MKNWRDTVVHRYLGDTTDRLLWRVADAVYAARGLYRKCGGKTRATLEYASFCVMFHSDSRRMRVSDHSCCRACYDARLLFSTTPCVDSHSGRWRGCLDRCPLAKQATHE